LWSMCVPEQAMVNYSEVLSRPGICKKKDVA
jgi:hypothetical protein